MPSWWLIALLGNGCQISADAVDAGEVDAGPASFMGVWTTTASQDVGSCSDGSNFQHWERFIPTSPAEIWWVASTDELLFMAPADQYPRCTMKWKVKSDGGSATSEQPCTSDWSTGGIDPVSNCSGTDVKFETGALSLAGDTIQISGSHTNRIFCWMSVADCSGQLSVTMTRRVSDLGAPPDAF
jgi:hypothetical protein